jgi:polyferredoxin
LSEIQEREKSPWEPDLSAPKKRPKPDIAYLKSKRKWYNSGKKLRKLIQYGFFITTVIIGVQFVLWYKYYESGGKLIKVARPAGVEGFLPLSGLISLKYWALTGIINDIHPAAMFVLLGIVAMSLVFKKSFCGYICPVGLISEWLWKLGRKLFGKKAVAPWGWRVPKFIDYPLRSLKYILLLFFLNAILLVMTEPVLKAFIDSPYNKVADAKMLLFFTDISQFALGVIILLAIASLFISNFWCRYLCPYGALVGVVSFLSPVKIRRNLSTCTDCGACSKVCPSAIKVDKEKLVRSDECIGCLECVAACPVKNTLYPEIGIIKKRISPRVFAIGALFIFLLFYIGARMGGYWDNNISDEEYMFHIGKMGQQEYTHPR